MRVVLAEDEALMREGLELVLGRVGFEVAGTAADFDDLLRKTRAHRPDLVVTDLRMPPSHSDEGLRAARAIRTEQPDTAILVLSHHVEPTYALELLEAAATGLGYLLKQRVSNVELFVRDLERISSGGLVLDPEVAAALVGRSRRAGAALDGLTDRQLEVLAAMAQGRSNAAIARELALSEKAVVGHVSRLYEALGLAQAPDDHRRVLAVIRYLDSATRPGRRPSWSGSRPAY